MIDGRVDLRQVNHARLDGVDALGDEFLLVRIQVLLHRFGIDVRDQRAVMKGELSCLLVGRAGEFPLVRPVDEIVATIDRALNAERRAQGVEKDPRIVILVQLVMRLRDEKCKACVA